MCSKCSLLAVPTCSLLAVPTCSLCEVPTCSLCEVPTCSLCVVPTCAVHPPLPSPKPRPPTRWCITRDPPSTSPEEEVLGPVVYPAPDHEPPLAHGLVSLLTALPPRSSSSRSTRLPWDLHRRLSHPHCVYSGLLPKSPTTYGYECDGIDASRKAFGDGAGTGKDVHSACRAHTLPFFCWL